MERNEYIESVLAFKNNTHRMELKAGECGAVPLTKIGGIPWWPKGLSRPRCSENHLMSFIAQIRLADIPNLECGGGELLSYHY